MDLQKTLELEGRVAALEQIVMGHGDVSGLVHRGQQIGQIDHGNETLTIFGITYSLEALRVLGDLKNVGRDFTFIRNVGGVLELAWKEPF